MAAAQLSRMNAVSSGRGLMAAPIRPASSLSPRRRHAGDGSPPSGLASSDMELPPCKGSQYLFLGPIGDDAALIHDDQAIDQGEQRGAMRDEQQRAAFELGRESRFEQLFGAVVHRAAG